MTGEPISFYVPARNAERTLAACLESIQGQTRPPDELFLVVDPRSSDRTAEIAAASGLPIVEQQGATLGAARNEAILAARHRWLACCDSDVVLEPAWLERLAARRDGSTAGIGGRTIERVCSPFDAWRALNMPHHWGDHPLRNPFMLVSEVLFDTQALRAVGGYRDDLNYYEDSDLCQRLRGGGYDLLYEPSAVATHQRTDDLLGLLTLRWKYSEYRQRHLMDRYANLIHKIRINREYALNTLCRALARGREELAYISFLLFHHHLVLDLRSLNSRRPLLSPAARADCERKLARAVVDTISSIDKALAEWVSRDLGKLTAADPAEDDGPGPPAWPDYLQRAAAAAGSFCRELRSDVRGIIAGSARHVHAPSDESPVPRLAEPSKSDLQAALDLQPIEPLADEAFIRAIRDQWPDGGPLRVLGPLHDREKSAFERGEGGSAAGTPVVVMVHMEARPDPLALFDELQGDLRRLVACYQPPTRFVPGLDVASASDLASAAAAAGWDIKRFDSFVGRTRLMLSR